MEIKHNNILVFNQFVAQIFSELYSEFPIPMTIDLNSIEADHPSSKKLFFKSTATWLQDAGYISFSNIDASQTRIFNCVLTAKGLESLNAMPNGLTGTHTLGDTLGECVKQGAREHTVETVKKILGVGVTLMTGC